MIRILAAAAVLSLAAASSAAADEGMWTYDAFPAAAVQQKYGVRIDQAWLDRVRGAGVRLSSGCSASVVSDQGLVLTNHHCVSDCVEVLSTAQRNYVETGFVAARREEELRCAGMRAEVLQSIRDVTERVAGAAEGKTGAAYLQARDGEVAAIEKDACAGQETTHRCQVVTLHQGGQFKLHVFRSYRDVRLALAPEFKLAFFGGDPDNFNFPRYDLDFAFLRLYDGGRPAATPTRLAWTAQAPKAGEVVFVVGNPGSTSRQLTAEQLRFLRDHALPMQQLLRSELRGRLIRFSQEGAEKARIANHDLFALENSFKATNGQLRALVESGLIADKAKADQALKARAAERPGLGDPWREIAEVQDDYAALFARLELLERRAGSLSQLFDYARTLVRGAEERAKPNAARLPEFADSRLGPTEQALLEPRPVDAALEQLYLEFWLSKAREHLTVDDADVRTLLGRESPEALAARLATSQLADPAVRRALWRGGAAAVAASQDPMIRFVAATDAAARGVRTDYERRVAAPVGRAAERIAHAAFALYGADIYPDATFSPRISYGAVEGWTYQGRTVGPFTQLGGLFERATGQAPYDLPQRWMALKDRLDLAAPFDLASSNDIVGGNSGSPLINARGEVVGAIFDGNIHSLGGAYGYDPALNRAISVSTAAITEALRKAYDARALLEELRVR